MSFSYLLASGATSGATTSPVAVNRQLYPEVNAYVSPAANVTCSVVIEGLPEAIPNDVNAVWIPLTDAITAAGGYTVKSFPLMRATFTTDGAVTIGLEGNEDYR
jgi:hypothetical protein